jgi:isoleucyl-tRNA synthetase
MSLPKKTNAGSADATQTKSDVARREEEILAFWRKNDTFKKSLEKPSTGEFVFYDGPPFATGLPHYGHILPGTIKDAIPRFQTMRGKRVRRQWGWDTHGLPIENLIEKKLGFNTKKDIEDFGIDRFNEEAKNSVLEYRDSWKDIIARSGRWADMDDDYKTMDPSYSESVWWVFKSLYEKGYVYQGFKSMHVCPRCETTLSNFEVNLGYADIKDIAVTVKLALKKEAHTFLLVWTTTPWTLPGNMAAAVNRNVFYSKVEYDGALYWVATDTLERVFAGKEHKVVQKERGSALVGLSYTPPFPYFLDKDVKNKENAWKVYDADYVTTNDGTGIVHLAPAFGEEDLEKAREEGIPIVHHVRKDGTFMGDVTDFASRKVKPKSADREGHMETDIEIVKWLARENLLFSKEKITHSYPHCWRCDTPLLNYASDSWFIAVTKMKDALLRENSRVHWVPAEIGSGRFGKWLESARDWAVSRERYWGAPLPVWKSDDGSETHIFGSLRELRLHSRDALTEIVVMRHAESEKNIGDYIDSSRDRFDLTPEGKRQALEAAASLKGAVDYVYASPVLRAKRTAEIIAEEIGLEVTIDERLRELDSGHWDGKKTSDPSIASERSAFLALAPDERYRAKHGSTGESWEDLEKRTDAFLDTIIARHKGKSVLIVTHQGAVGIIEKRATQWSLDEHFFRNLSNGPHAKPKSYTFLSDSLFPFDFHRPHIDSIVAYSPRGTPLKRVPEVFDTWYESGSMPYGQFHYPFENLDAFDPSRRKGFPADFIAEGLDQTRGWFYSLIVLGVGLFDTAPYKNVIVHGLVLAEDGKKMSKRLKNYPDIEDVFNTYGADSLRYYLLSSPVIRGEELRFSEKEVADIMRKLIVRLDNVRAFYELYRDASLEGGDIFKAQMKNPLDVWIVNRTAELEETVRTAMDRYELDNATRPILDFVDDLSTWYLRRSRSRFKHKDDTQDAKDARATLYGVLKTLSKILAPFTPFYADYLYRSLKHDDEPESVHLSLWPVVSYTQKHKEILESMKRVRDIVSSGLQERSSAGIKVRQPLRELKYGGEKLERDLEAIIADELNVKAVVHKKGDTAVRLDAVLDESLVEEGIVRELIRFIQSKRKEMGLSPHESVALSILTNARGAAILSKHTEIIVQTVSARDLIIEDVSKDERGADTLTIEDIPFSVRLTE